MRQEGSDSCRGRRWLGTRGPGNGPVAQMKAGERRRRAALWWGQREQDGDGARDSLQWGCLARLLIARL